MRTFLVGLVIATVAVAGCSQDAGKELACREFGSLASDWTARVVTVDEVRDRTRSIYDDAKLSDDVAVTDAAQRLASSARDGLTDADAETVTALDVACG